MDSILMSLMTALNEQLLINVYQRDTDDFYTGYVQVLGRDHVVLSTFNDYGIADGAVLLSFNIIATVEFAGADLADMEFRMNVAKREHFLSVAGLDAALQFDPRANLLGQLATQVQASGQMIMVILADDEAYLEGQVTAVAADRFTLNVFNKFNYTDVRALQVDFSDVLVVEFGGLDLHQETELVRHRDQLHHVKTVLHQNDGQLGTVLAAAQAANRLIAVVPRESEDQFFVGTVRAVNDTVVILALRDMAAQFGGYVAIRIRAIQSITTASDYLQTVSAYAAWDEAHDLVLQPVLNAERAFDANDDLFKVLVNEAAAFQRVIRVRTATDETHMVGYPVQVAPNSFMLHLIDPDDGSVAEISFDAVLEVAFGHLFAYLAEAELHEE
ncbi:hypothetical protein [Lacticaseibacillus nasuensis]|uniref:Uncharacterized protein n=1 Tax=Lacticaseibacillus nasuensis JCM 17158 TaxID=1291734 RepID=A0A0R1K3E5_9LACO|nr:hypothetical protein [Lacticaseibacillus nasuensis]KRK73831.1 hypothetical protein FD02_GL001661 [Lacticaseibacillus nasuensis JCM 17158]